MDWLPRRRPPSGRHAVTLITRAGCHLCDDAERELERLAGEWAFDLRVVDLDAAADPTWPARYGDRVPVILLDGREHGYWRVEPERLRAALRR